MSARKKSKKRSAAVYAVVQFFKLFGATALIVAAFSLIIAAALSIPFIDREKNDEYTVKIRTKALTKAVTVKVGDKEIVSQGYFPVSALNGIMGVRVVGDSKGISISNPSGTEVMELTPDSNVIIVNGTWKQSENTVLYKDGECYLPMDLIEKYTCLSVSYDETSSLYTVSTSGAEDISFFPKNAVSDVPEKVLAK